MMGKVLDSGRSPSGRAATPSGPSPTVSGIAGIPNAGDELVEFFNTPDGYRRFGHRGDYEGWPPEKTAAHFLAEYAARLSQADGGVVGLPATGTLRLCGYCRSWSSKPCGEQCVLSANDPTWEQVTASGIEGEAGDPKGLHPEGESPARSEAKGDAR